MRDIKIPEFGDADIYYTCVNSISDSALKKRLLSAQKIIEGTFPEYEFRAARSELYLIIGNMDDKKSTYHSGLTKQIFIDIYSRQMAKLGKPGRVFYDAIKMAAPNEICPVCGCNNVETVDHYLPKSKFPQYSIFVKNLVPACYLCNFGKNDTSPLTRNEQPIHPYYDSHLLSEQWLFADVVRGNPVSIRYFVNAPRFWQKFERERVLFHFNNFDLSRRYSLKAAEELSHLHDVIMTHKKDVNGIKLILGELAELSYGKCKNSWRTALHQAVANSDWYCRGGYQDY